MITFDGLINLLPSSSACVVSLGLLAASDQQNEANGRTRQSAIFGVSSCTCSPETTEANTQVEILRGPEELHRCQVHFWVHWCDSTPIKLKQTNGGTVCPERLRHFAQTLLSSAYCRGGKALIDLAGMTSHILCTFDQTSKVWASRSALRSCGTEMAAIYHRLSCYRSHLLGAYEPTIKFLWENTFLLSFCKVAYPLMCHVHLPF